MPYLGLYIAYRILRRPAPQRETYLQPDLFDIWFASIITSMIFVGFGLLFLTAGPLWMVLPFAFAELVVVLCTAYSIVERSERLNGQQVQNQRHGI